jgi:hypothetical protein
MNTHLTSDELTKIWSAVDPDKIDRVILDKLYDRFVELREAEERHKEDERRRSEAIPQVVPDFKDVSVGTVVVRSEHFKKEHSYNKSRFDQIGMIVEIKIYEDDLCVASYWPVVHWEGEHSSSTNHPLNVSCKDGRILPTRTINSNQQSKKK